MSIWDDSTFCEPTDAVGDWQFASSACFEHEHAPTAMKYATEKVPGTSMDCEGRVGMEGRSESSELRCARHMH